jgi:hypothetical protein
MIFFGLDAQDSPYHLLHYKLRLISQHSSLSDFLGMMLVSLIERLNESHNTMIFIRLVNWLLINIPFLCLFVIQYKKNNPNIKLNLIVILLLFINIFTNWNTLCWDSWNRLIWFIILWFFVVKNSNEKKSIYLESFILSVFSIVAIGIKSPNVVIIPSVFLYLILRLEYSYSKRFSAIGIYVVSCFFWFGLILNYQPKILNYFNLNWYVSEVSNNTHTVLSLLFSNVQQLVIYIVLRMLLWLLKKKSAFVDLFTFVSFSVVCLIGYNFINIPNSGLAFLVIFLYLEFLYLLLIKNILDSKLNFIWFAIIPFLYSAGSDLALYKAYWVIPQSLGLLLLVYGEKIVARTDVDIKVATYALIMISILSLNNQLFGNLYKSSRLVNSSKMVEQVPFNHIKVDYFEKKLLTDQNEKLIQHWDYDTSHLNIIIGSQSFIFSNYLEFRRNMLLPKNYYSFKSIHAGIHDSSGILNVINEINKFSDNKKATRIFNFEKHHEIPDILYIGKDTVYRIHNSSGLQILKINKEVK